MTLHNRHEDDECQEHARSSDKIIVNLLNQLMKTNSLLGEIQGRVDAGLSNLETRFNDLDTKLGTHMHDEEKDLNSLKSQFNEFKTSILLELQSIKTDVQDITPYISSRKESAIAWKWATEKIPRAFDQLYKLVFAIAALGIGSWAFIEYIIYKKLG